MTKEEARKRADSLVDDWVEASAEFSTVSPDDAKTLVDAIVAFAEEVRREQREKDAQIMCRFCQEPEKYAPAAREEGYDSVWIHRGADNVPRATHCEATAIRNEDENQ